MKPTGLGRGLGALLGDEANRQDKSGHVMLRIAQVEPNAAQPRQVFEESALSDLAESIRHQGVLQPLLVRELPTGAYQIIAGERRWRAARMAGLTEVPAIVFEADDKRATEIALIENLQREDLNPMEEAEGLFHLIEDFGMTQEEAALTVGRSRPAVANSLRLLTLSDKVRALVSNGTLSAGHARAILGLSGQAKQEKAAELVIERGLSVRQTELLVRKMSSPSRAKKPTAPNYLLEHERRLTQGLGRKVSIVSTAKKGKMTIEFYGATDLERLMETIERAIGREQ